MHCAPQLMLFRKELIGTPRPPTAKNNERNRKAHIYILFVSHLISPPPLRRLPTPTLPLSCLYLNNAEKDITVQRKQGIRAELRILLRCRRTERRRETQATQEEHPALQTPTHHFTKPGSSSVSQTLLSLCMDIEMMQYRNTLQKNQDEERREEGDSTHLARHESTLQTPLGFLLPFPGFPVQILT